MYLKGSYSIGCQLSNPIDVVFCKSKPENAMHKFLLSTSLWIFLFIIRLPEVSATHIVGGDISYRCLGGDRYEITLTLRRDCLFGQPPFDNPASVGIFDEHGVLQAHLGSSGRLIMTYRQDDTLNEIAFKNCGIVGGDVCVHTTTYREVVDLPFQPGGYILAYQRCCRNQTILNIVDPLMTGATYTLHITDEALRICNSSPVLSPYPPIYICGNQPINFDLSAKDAEGDSIAYFMCSPYHGASQSNPLPPIPSSPPYQAVIFRSPYHDDDMIGGQPPLQIHPKTGLMTGFAVNLVAQYLVAYCVEEYRDGKLLSSMRRDFQINVRLCNSVPIADFNIVHDKCKNPIELALIDKSSDQYSSIDSWSWLLLLNSIPYFSYDQHPTFYLTDTGTASIRLIIHSKESCSDTIWKEVKLQSIAPTIDSLTRNICLGDTISIVRAFTPGLQYQWSPVDGLSCSNCPNPLAYPVRNTTYVLTTSDRTCQRTDSIKIKVRPCTLDSCEINIQQTCLPSGMIEIAVKNWKGELVQPKSRVHELYWNVLQHGNQPAYSLSNVNPILLTQHRNFAVTSKIYTWQAHVPHTVEFADICKRVLQGTADLNCSGPCEDIQFILSSCGDDYDLANHLNYPSSICQSICSNACMYIVGLFETNGNLVDPSKYKISWSTGGSGAYVMMKGPYYNNLTVKVEKDGCNWYGRYWKSCNHYTGNMIADLSSQELIINQFPNGINSFNGLSKSVQNIHLFNANGQLISINPNINFQELTPGLYFIKIGESKLNKFIKLE